MENILPGKITCPRHDCLRLETEKSNCNAKVKWLLQIKQESNSVHCTGLWDFHALCAQSDFIWSPFIKENIPISPGKQISPSKQFCTRLSLYHMSLLSVQVKTTEHENTSVELEILCLFSSEVCSSQTPPGEWGKMLQSHKSEVVLGTFY